MTDEQARNIVNAVWGELRSRKGLEIEEIVWDREVQQDIYDGLKDAVLAAASGSQFDDPLSEDDDD